MTTYKLGLPSELKRWLEIVLPQAGGGHILGIRVTPRDHRERKCAAYEADHYEVQAYYTMFDPGLLDALEEALKARPGVYLTTQVVPVSAQPPVVRFTNDAWPAALGTSRRNHQDLRPQVIALIRDETATVAGEGEARNG